jgi:hypothetical protein
MNSVYDTNTAVNEAKKALEGVEFDTFVGTGLSGALMIPALSKAFCVDFLMVRKKNDGSHSEYPCEGYLGERWIFVDDLIATGDTFTRVAQVVRAAAAWENHQTELVGAYLYERAEFRSGDRVSRWKLPPLLHRPKYNEFREGPYDDPPKPLKFEDLDKPEEAKQIGDLLLSIKKRPASVLRQQLPEESDIYTGSFDRPKMDPEKKRELMKAMYSGPDFKAEPGSFAEFLTAPAGTPLISMAGV